MFTAHAASRSPTRQRGIDFYCQGLAFVARLSELMRRLDRAVEIREYRRIAYRGDPFGFDLSCSPAPATTTPCRTAPRRAGAGGILACILSALGVLS
jgi:hypothetical protein